MNMKKILSDKFAFTLAETLIVLAILGVVATLTIPSVYRKYTNHVNKTKIKKAMEVYTAVLSTIVYENNIISESGLKAWSEKNAENNCSYSSFYFKTVEGSGCIFKTSDGVWWYLADIENPLISLTKIETGGANNLENAINRAKSESNTTAFYFVGRYDSQTYSLRINDMFYEREKDGESDYYKYLSKLYNYLEGKIAENSDVIAGATEEPSRKEPIKIEDIPKIIPEYFPKYENEEAHIQEIIDKLYDNERGKKLQNGDYDNACTTKPYTGCTDCRKSSSQYSCKVYDDNGKQIYNKTGCDTSYNNCTKTQLYFDDGNTTSRLDTNCNGDVCERTIVYNEAGHNELSIYYNSDGTIKSFDERTHKTEDLTKTITKREGCNLDGICKNSYIYVESGDEYTYKYEMSYYNNGNIKTIKENSDDGDKLLKQITLNNDENNTIQKYDEYTYSDDGSTLTYKVEACTLSGMCHHQDTYNEQGKRTIKKFNYDLNTGDYKYYDENIYDDAGTTITGTRSNCNSQGVCSKCTGTGC